MSGDILVRLVEVTKYFRQDKAGQSVYERFIQNDKNRHTSINKVTIHLYKGETLGIVGVAGSGKTVLGQLIAKVIEPNSGRVRNHFSTFLATHSSTTHSVNQFIETVLLSYNVPLIEYAELKHDILIFAELTDKDKMKVNELTLAERAQMLIALTRFLMPEVVIYNDLTKHLSESFKKKFAQVIDHLIAHDKSVVLMEENPDLVLYKAEYVNWLSHGQLRKSGEPGEVLPLYLEYYKRCEQVKGSQKEDLFDLDYKVRRETEEKHELKRVNRHVRTYLDSELKKWIPISLGIILLGLLFFTLILRDIKYEPAVVEQQTAAINKQAETYTDKYALAVTKENTKLMHRNKAALQLPAGSLIEVTGIGNEDYRIAFNNKEMSVDRENVVYINPAALYDERSFEDLKPYMYSNYVNFNEFFNGFLGASRTKVEAELFPETRAPYVIKLTKNDIYLHFNDQNKVNGIGFPMTQAEQMKKKFNLKEKDWIVKVDDGYAVADLEANMWLYFRR
ncbi:ABC transporter ATP-binding protein [Macrococcus hajekii]|uniref:ABC transporter ATP-binding protein n=1 Tax=Macrococcus hajekii TaxID=198482 RepID=A0A4R6BI85_9STAP|nr:ATP-binding cassette domain-containing protein [Macrococcus hajekii]TDM01277.1 ABC transporter ATP-binding protein [Macrococcus hajekii]GGB10272.1 teichoic acid ABC transporter ATP-binding protein [Macrococcus hajekii]